jgi:hypothetical protein
MALIYLVAWPATLAGVLLISLSGQWAYAIFVSGAITLTLWGRLTSMAGTRKDVTGCPRRRCLSA